MLFIVQTENVARTGSERERHREHVLGTDAPEGTKTAYLRVDGRGSFVLVEAPDEATAQKHAQEFSPYAQVVQVVPVITRDAFVAHLPSKPEGQPVREFLQELARKLG